MNARATAKQDVGENVKSYFLDHLRKLERNVSSDAVVTGEVKQQQGEVEVTVNVISVDWQSRMRKRDSNPYVAIDSAFDAITDSFADSFTTTETIDLDVMRAQRALKKTS